VYYRLTNEEEDGRRKEDGIKGIKDNGGGQGGNVKGQ
jgi:hypothetical protein